VQSFGRMPSFRDAVRSLAEEFGIEAPEPLPAVTSRPSASPERGVVYVG
jgi:hypothetical protein